MKAQASKVHDFVELLQRLVSEAPMERREASKILMEMARLEREIQSAKKSIIEELAKGTAEAPERAELARLTLSIAAIASHARAAARKVVALSDLIDNVKGHAKALAGFAENSVLILVNAVGKLEEDPAESLAMAAKIEDLKRAADERLAEAEASILRECDRDGRLSACLALLRLFTLLALVTSQAESAANVLRVLIVVKTYTPQ
ncbi:hypothetical protein JCM10135_04890 [Stetteria hydrogenophila]